MSPKVKTATFKHSALGKTPWSFAIGQERKIFEKAKHCSNKLSSVIEQVIVGIQTSADLIYILNNLGPGSKQGTIRVYSKAQQQELELEASLLKPLISGRDIERYGNPHPSQLLIFPYELQQGKGASLIPSDKFKRKYPLIWDYLESNKSDLSGRENGKMDHEQWYAYVYPKNLDKHEQPKLCVPRLVNRLKVVLDAKGNFYLDNVDVNGILFSTDPAQSPSYLSAVLNSRLLDFLFKKGSVRFRGAFFSANKQFIEPLPIRRVNFTTSVTERTQLVGKGKKLYEQCLAKNDFLCVTVFVDHCLKQKPEQTDVVHDLLAFLAEQMMEMNKKKQDDVESFPEWLETIIGPKIDSLKNKTKVRAYHGGSLEDLLEILKENRKALKINPSSKSFYEDLKDAFQKSLSKLTPLKARIATTDRLIDLIVYQLYGLTEEEIKIVEGG